MNKTFFFTLALIFIAVGALGIVQREMREASDDLSVPLADDHLAGESLLATTVPSLISNEERAVISTQ